MGELRTFRARRKSAAERRALLSVQRELRLIDSCSRTKYLKDFREAFRAYERLLLPDEIESFAKSCDVLLIGDYHALPSSQQFTARLAIQLKQEGDRSVIVGVEPIFKRDQAILDDWQAGSIPDSELRMRLRFDNQWGYAWEPFIQMLHMLRRSGIPMFGLDCYPRGDMRRIGTRDRHAAMMVAELEARYPDSQILVSFGESHLAPQHLPAAVKKRLPDAQVHTILQNLDELYWRAAGESVLIPLQNFQDFRVVWIRGKRLLQCAADLLSNGPLDAHAFDEKVVSLILFDGVFGCEAMEMVVPNPVGNQLVPCGEPVVGWVDEKLTWVHIFAPRLTNSTVS